MRKNKSAPAPKKRGGVQTPKPVSKDELGALRRRGMRLKDIAAHFDCTVDHISVKLREYKLPLKWGGPTAVRMYPERYAGTGARKYGKP